MATFTKLNSMVQKLAEGGFNLATDQIKVMFTNTAPASTAAVKGDITEIAAGGGYTAGGVALTTSSEGQTAGTEKLVVADQTFTATGSVGPFRYAVVYDATTNNLLGYYDYGSATTLASGDSITLDFDHPGGLLTIA